jgi:hypothetical protein
LEITIDELAYQTGLATCSTLFGLTEPFADNDRQSDNTALASPTQNILSKE